MNTSLAVGVGTIEVDDFSPLSRYDHDFAHDLRDAVLELNDHDDVKVVLLRATGPDFAPPGAAGDQDRPSGLPAWRRDFAGSAAIYQTLCFSKKVVVTEVQGRCTGAGTVLVLCSDLTVAGEDSTFGSPFAAIPEANFALASLTMRLNRAKAWALTDDVLPAEQAHAIGLVNFLEPVDQVWSRTASLAQDVCRMPLDGITMSKMLLQAVLDGHGVGREFDMAPHYARDLWGGK
ncbi:enoyl-CoA hydratase/isomerase family protein [Geodermatophilus sabuli]|uniref:Enoyl-CoA hydratase/isomerase family protein n=1 Tax=Geodermatophilus sabuli TaxID=1564158 RepID=A0A7K3VZ17_9ACTN|nr:enoyl-CoA hydratase/isomerase family protein [Geodermatophilus sabuli]NEK56877.1 enoyl-CoA hydratase/isomerase family protein [Geodermatophilus sabuli]